MTTEFKHTPEKKNNTFNANMNARLMKSSIAIRLFEQKHNVTIKMLFKAESI
jgi:hypothetical protein